ECREFLAPLVFGGEQEGGLRSGTLPVPLVVGLGKACDVTRLEFPKEAERIFGLRERLRSKLIDAMPATVVHGHPVQHLPGLLSIGIDGVDGDVVLHALTGLAISQGSSCTQGAFEPSHVLRAIGLSYE